MKSNYKRLGNYIRQVNVRNDGGNVDLLLGVNLDKVFIPSVANTVGTDMTKYKIINKGQFGCKLMSVGRDKRLPISRLLDYDKALISSAYFVFEVKDEHILNPEYLMMWFLRSESDRYLWFQSGGDVRGRVTWKEFCSLPIIIPSIEKQREIVAEYNAVTNRIKLNEQLNQKLEETAQALYKHWFVDFNFPITKESCPELVSGSPELEGKPYKSSGGDMVYNEELDKEIPEGWQVVSLSDICDVTFSKRIFQSEYSEKGVPFYRSKEIILKKKGFKISNELYISQDRYKEITDKFGAILEGDILLTAVGTIGISYQISNSDHFYFKDGNLFWFKNFKKEGYNKLIYQWMQTPFFKETLEEITFGSTQKVITTTAVYLLKHVIPNIKTLNSFCFSTSKIDQEIDLLRSESLLLGKLKDLLLSKMSKVEVEDELVNKKA